MIDAIDDIAASITGSSDNRYQDIYREALNSTLLQELISGQQTLFIANARVISDKPEKLDHDIDGEYMLLATALGELLAQASTGKPTLDYGFSFNLMALRVFS